MKCEIDAFGCLDCNNTCGYYIEDKNTNLETIAIGIRVEATEEYNEEEVTKKLSEEIVKILVERDLISYEIKGKLFGGVFAKAGITVLKTK